MRPARRASVSAVAFLLFLGLCLRGPVASGEDSPSPKPPEPAAGGGADQPTEDLIDDTEDGPEDFVKAVNKAIDLGVAWLKKKQGPDGSYDGITGDAAYGGGAAKVGQRDHPSGPTSLAMYALLKCKVPMNDPVVKKGFNFLKTKHRLPGSSYETSMMLLAVTATADPFKKRSASESAAASDKVKLTGEYRGWAVDLQKHLLKKRQSGGGWRYQAPGYAIPPGGDQDLSSTQLAALALFAAERCGIKTESKVWNDMITYAMKQQEADGPSVDRAVEAREPKGKGDKKDEAPGGAGGAKPKDRARGHAYILSTSLAPHEGEATGGMTACGLGVIMMARFILMHREHDKLWAARNKEEVQQSVYDSVAWLNYHWQPIQNPRGRDYHLYYLYCVERAFDMIGNARLGPHFWYVEMGNRLLSIQKPQGFWDTSSTLRPQDTLDTCFALLFLKRATRGGIPFPNITGGSEEPPADNRGK